MIKPINDYVFFTCDKEAEDELRLNAGLILKIATQAEHGRFNRIYGEVIAVPGKLSHENLFQKATGLPEPKANYSGEMVEELAKAGYRVTGREYECTPYEREYYKLSDIAMEVMPGDKIYFHFNTIDEENKYTLADGRKIYKVRYDQIICIVRDGKIIPIGSHVLVSMVWDEDVVEIDLTNVKIPGHSPVSSVKGKINKFNIVTELHEKPKPLEGIVRHIGNSLDGEVELGIVPGDRVIFLPESDWVNVIEGKEYFVMKQRDLIAKIE